MDKETQQYFNDLFEMFTVPGWERLVQELLVTKEALEHIQSIKDQDELKLRQGQLLVINNILNLKETLERAYEDSNAQGA